MHLVNFPLFISVILCVIFPTFQIYNRIEQPLTYRAAVVEYAVFDDAVEIGVNVDNYVKLIRKAAKLGVDIIAFPEYGLTPNKLYATREDYIPISTYVPLPEDAVVPFLNSSDRFSGALKNLSLSAKRNRIYVLANMDEIDDCNPENEPCHPDKLNLYNTNVVFDRDGKIIARYRKTHLYDEPFKNHPPIPEISYFDTDFGVRFGSFICFDILFQQPALNLTRNFGIKNIIFSTEWQSAVPFQTALQTEQSWAFTENANLLAANINDPPNSGSGSGIFHADHRLPDFFYVTNEKITTLLISDVMKEKSKHLPKKLFTNYQQFKFDINGRLVETVHHPNPMPSENFDQYSYWPYFLTNYSSIALDLNRTRQNFKLCSGELCCTMNVTLKFREVHPEKNMYQYRFVIYNGLMDNDFEGLYGKNGIFTCGLVACLNSTVDSCGIPFDEYKSIDWPVSFQKIAIGARYKPDNTTDFPCTLQPGLRPLSKEFWSYNKIDQDHVNFFLLKPVDQLLTFSFFAYNFTENIPPIIN